LTRSRGKDAAETRAAIESEFPKEKEAIGMDRITRTHTIYILFTRTETYFSRLIRLFTDDKFTHAAIGLDGPSGAFYSFGRKNPPHALPAGLVEERLYPEALRYPEGTPCCLCTLDLSEEAYCRLRRQLRSMLSSQELYHYNLLGVMSCLFRFPLQRRYHYFCSQFVSALLTDCGALRLEKPPALTRPSDLYGSALLQMIYSGVTNELPHLSAA